MRVPSCGQQIIENVEIETSPLIVSAIVLGYENNTKNGTSVIKESPGSGKTERDSMQVGSSVIENTDANMQDSCVKRTSRKSVRISDLKS